MTITKSANEVAELHRDDDGFTLVELLVVLAIIGLLTAIAAPQVLGYLGAARVDTAKAQMKNLEGALELLYLDTGQYPQTEEGLAALIQKPPTATAWNGPYIKQAAALKDPWGNPYQYKGPDGSTEYTIWSLGRDGKPGGEGLDADIYSH